MNKPKSSGFKKVALSASIATALSLGSAQNSFADLYEFTFANGGCFVNGIVDTCTGPGDGLFTMLTSAGASLQNTSYPYYADTTWGYGKRTQMGGTLSIDVEAGVGSATIAPFAFYNGGNAIASSITMKDVPDVDDPNGAGGHLWIANMNFDWNNNPPILTQNVFDLVGLMAELPPTAGSVPALNSVFDATSCGVSGVCATPGSNAMKGSLPIGVVPVATSTYNVLGATGTSTVLADLSLGADDGYGGTPMDNGPFGGFNANFDMATLTLSAYNDTTPPTITLGSTSTILNIGDAFDVNNPGVSVTCADNADGNDDITNAVGVNTNISFTADNGNGGAAVNTAVAGSYEVLYTCTDNAGARDELTDDPNNPGSVSIPADNTSPSTTVLTVIVAHATDPSIIITNGTPTSHEACTVYADAGATTYDIIDGAGVVTLITDATPIIGGGNEPNEGSYSIVYNATDSNFNTALPKTRTVNVTDTIAPSITITGGAAVDVESSQSGVWVNNTAAAMDANGDCNPVVGGAATTPDSVVFTVPTGDDSIATPLRYFASDSSTAGNQSQENQTVTVTRSEPVISLIGGDIVLNVGDTYTEQGMDVRDVQDGLLSAVTTSGTTAGTTIVAAPVPFGAGSGNLIHNIVIRDATTTVVGAVDTATSGGRFTISYDVTDSDGYTATTVTRRISVGVFASASNFTMLTKGAGLTFGGTNDVVFDWDQSLNNSAVDTNFNMTIASALPQPFFSYAWTAHHVRVFGPGNYSFDATCTTTQLENGIAACNNPLVGAQVSRFLQLPVPTGHIGVHMLFDWGVPDPSTSCGVANCDIDVVNVWRENFVWNDPDGDATEKNNLFLGDAGSAPDVTQPWFLASIDVNGDGINGMPMVDGPFIGFYANFNAGPGGTTVVVPFEGTADNTLLGGGSMSLGALLTSLVSLLGFGLFRKVKYKANK